MRREEAISGAWPAWGAHLGGPWGRLCLQPARQLTGDPGLPGGALPPPAPDAPQQVQESSARVVQGSESPPGFLLELRRHEPQSLEPSPSPPHMAELKRVCRETQQWRPGSTLASTTSPRQGSALPLPPAAAVTVHADSPMKTKGLLPRPDRGRRSVQGLKSLVCTLTTSRHAQDTGLALRRW